MPNKTIMGRDCSWSKKVDFRISWFEGADFERNRLRTTTEQYFRLLYIFVEN